PRTFWPRRGRGGLSWQERMFVLQRQRGAIHLQRVPRKCIHLPLERKKRDGNDVVLGLLWSGSRTLRLLRWNWKGMNGGALGETVKGPFSRNATGWRRSKRVKCGQC